MEGVPSRMGVIRIRAVVALLASATLVACSANSTQSNVIAPGRSMDAVTATLEAGADVLQSRPPIDALNGYLDGFHFYNGHMRSQMEAHHYCAIINEEVIHCVIYDGNTKDAKLMGVEYSISAQLFATLSPDEKALWHSHVHEIRTARGARHSRAG